jgi:hypothetical protein
MLPKSFYEADITGISCITVVPNPDKDMSEKENY